MKKTVIAGIFGIIVLVGLMFLIASNTAITTPEKTVSSFYTAWFNGEFTISDSSYQNASELSKEFKTKIDSITSSFSSGGYDPVVCAQDFPIGFEIIPILVNDTNAEVGVREYFDTIVKDVKVSLVRENALWKITDVICGDMPKQDTTSSQFERVGNIVEKDNEWILIHEEQGKPALSMLLDFSDWRCGGGDDRCVPSFEQGARVKVIGKKINETVILVDSVVEL